MSLYAPSALRDLAGFRRLAVLNPYTEVVNSLVVAEKPQASQPDPRSPDAEELRGHDGASVLFSPAPKTSRRPVHRPSAASDLANER